MKRKLAIVENEINILLVDDHPFFVKGMFHYLSQYYNVAIANNGREAIELLKRKYFDLVISDTEMPLCDGKELTKYIKHHFQSTKLIITFASFDILAVKTYIDFNVNGIILKNANEKHLHDAVVCVLNNHCYYSPELYQVHVPIDNQNKNYYPSDLITNRQMEVLQFLKLGMTDQEIADVLIVSVQTIKSHVKHMLEKFGVKNRTSLVAKCRELGLV